MSLSHGGNEKQNCVLSGEMEENSLSSQTLPSSASTENLTLVRITSLSSPHPNKVWNSQPNAYFVVAVCSSIFIFVIFKCFWFACTLKITFQWHYCFLTQQVMFFRINYLKIINLCLFFSKNASPLKCSPMKHHYVPHIKASTFWLAPCSILFTKMLESF